MNSNRFSNSMSPSYPQINSPPKPIKTTKLSKIRSPKRAIFYRRKKSTKQKYSGSPLHSRPTLDSMLSRKNTVNSAARRLNKTTIIEDRRSQGSSRLMTMINRKVQTQRTKKEIKKARAEYRKVKSPGTSRKEKFTGKNDFSYENLSKIIKNVNIEPSRSSVKRKNGSPSNKRRDKEDSVNFSQNRKNLSDLIKTAKSFKPEKLNNLVSLQEINEEEIVDKKKVTREVVKSRLREGSEGSDKELVRFQRVESKTKRRKYRSQRHLKDSQSPKRSTRVDLKSLMTFQKKKTKKRFFEFKEQKFKKANSEYLEEENFKTKETITKSSTNYLKKTIKENKILERKRKERSSIERRIRFEGRNNESGNSAERSDATLKFQAMKGDFINLDKAIDEYRLEKKVFKKEYEFEKIQKMNKKLEKKGIFNSAIHQRELVRNAVKKIEDKIQQFERNSVERKKKSEPVYCYTDRNNTRLSLRARFEKKPRKSKNSQKRQKSKIYESSELEKEMSYKGALTCRKSKVTTSSPHISKISGFVISEEPWISQKDFDIFLGYRLKDGEFFIIKKVQLLLIKMLGRSDQLITEIELSNAIKAAPNSLELAETLTEDGHTYMFFKTGQLRLPLHLSKGLLSRVHKNLQNSQAKCIQLRSILDKDFDYFVNYEEYVSTIVRELANTLVYCHQRGIVHRDVNPENIFFIDVFFALIL
jgi:hypothetical protein